MFKLGFILSAGRTGTVLLEEILNKNYPEFCFLHEPSGSRYRYLLGNATLRHPVIRKMVARSFHRVLSKRIAEHTKQGKLGYIEINPMLSSIVDVLPEVMDELHCVHIVRHPIDWVISMTNFRASRMFRPFINYVPYNHPMPFPKPADWESKTERERLMWRWRIYNENIGNLRSLCRSYQLVKFEELTSCDLATAQGALKKVLIGLDVDIAPDVNWYAHPSKVNASEKSPLSLFESWSKQEQNALVEICGGQMREFGYEMV